MRPYYDEGGITIYHGDCRDILPSLNTVDLVLTDPPYGISYSPAPGGAGWYKNGKVWTGSDLVLGDDTPFDPTPLLRFPRLILWGANHYADKLPASPTWLIWHKRWFNDPMTSVDFADCEIAWSNVGGPARVYRYEWNGLLRAGQRGEHNHPTEKPLALMRWCLQRWSAVGDLILDSYMGSGTTLRAAKDLGRKAIGIEIEERYCEIAVKRLQQQAMILDAAPPPPVEQSAFEFAAP